MALKTLVVWLYHQILFCNKRTIYKESVTSIIIIISIVGVLTKISSSLLIFQVHFLKVHRRFLDLWSD